VRHAYLHAKLYAPDGVIDDGALLVGADGRIEAAGRTADVRVPDGTPRTDVSGLRLMPGFIDIHVHGGGGYQMMDATYEAVNGMSVFHASGGTTAFLATTVTASEERIRAALRNAAECMKRGVDGAELVGVHLEGPFLNPLRCGAQDAGHIRPFDADEMERYLTDAKGAIRVATLAPETPGGFGAVERLTARGVAVSLGHSDATLAEAAEAVARGARQTTHHFNGMRPLHHREPGLAGAGLLLESLTIELIVDGFHVHPEIVKLAFALKGPERVCAVTDAGFCAGLPDGVYGQKKMVGGRVTLLDDSSLAGSSLTMLEAFRRLLRMSGATPEAALPSFTTVPARLAGLSERKGALAPGMDADFLLLDDRLDLAATFVRGREAYRKRSDEGGGAE